MDETGRAEYEGVTFDRNGNAMFDQALIGEEDKEYIMMTRPAESVLEPERNRVNVMLGEADFDYWQEERSEVQAEYYCSNL
ncbi:MAG: hypothetical protein ABEJ72_11135 [Candidatus Aenigmatarchaeota archaeon]